MAEEIVFHSVEEFERHYFPKRYEENNRDKKCPGEIGREIADKGLEEAGRILRS